MFKISVGVVGDQKSKSAIPAVRRLRHGDDLHHRRLAGAIFAQQRVHLAGSYVEIEVFQVTDAVDTPRAGPAGVTVRARTEAARVLGPADRSTAPLPADLLGSPPLGDRVVLGQQFSSWRRLVLELWSCRPGSPLLVAPCYPLEQTPALLESVALVAADICR